MCTRVCGEWMKQKEGVKETRKLCSEGKKKIKDKRIKKKKKKG